MKRKGTGREYRLWKAVVVAAAFMILLAGFARAEEMYEGSVTYTQCYELADQVLDVIITDDMDDYEKCRAVYDYLHKISYINEVYSDDWVINGYYMLYKRAGDCYGYYSASRLLLERLGYQVFKMENNNGFTHCWCLVSVDDGETWYHFDPTCWRWGSDAYLCMVTDEELTNYAWMHYYTAGTMSHTWDQEKQAAQIKAYRDKDKNSTRKAWTPQNP